MVSALVIGVIFGATAGFAPGPLMTLVITQTLRHNTREGALAAVAPPVTDFPIVVASLLLVNQVATLDPLLGVLATAGALYVLFLAYETALAAPVVADSANAQPHSLRKAILVNALNPHPYLFWTTVGAPLVIRTHGENPIAPWLFIAAFYLFLVGSKVLIAVMIGRFRSFLAGKAYVNMMRALAMTKPDSIIARPYTKAAV